MMRRSRADKALTHSRVLAIAAKRFRERGLDGVGLAELMKEAGSSVGGFYKHFASREELVIEALAEAFKFLDRMESKSKDLPAFLEAFLSEQHYANPGAGCALTALVSDISHASGAVRTVYTQRVKQTLGYYTQRLTPADDSKRARAILLFCAATGGLALSRAVNDPSLANEILESLREQLATLSALPDGGVFDGTISKELLPHSPEKKA